MTVDIDPARDDGGPPMIREPITLADLIVRQAARTPDAPAVQDGSAVLTFAELMAEATALASVLRVHGITVDRPVALCADRSARMVVAMVAVLLADGVYLPVDPEWPDARLEHIAGEAAPAVVLCDAANASRMRSCFSAAAVLPLDSTGEGGGELGKRRAKPAHTAYLIYTSGSTGWPKGVAVPHAGVVNRLLWAREYQSIGPGDRLVQKTPTTFDVSVWELFCPLVSGATLVMAEPGGHRDPRYLIELIRREKITIAHFVPSMLTVFLQDPEAASCTSLRLIVASGEALSPATAARTRQLFPDARLFNMYGPTEASIDVTFWECEPLEDGRTVPIGYPLRGVTARVYDSDGAPVPVGSPGELYLGGVCLASGYLARPDLTDAAFVHTADRPDERQYRSGDLVRRHPSGHLEFLGRIDHQVKLRGLRIELGEIEAVASDHPLIASVVAMVREDVASTPKLVLYVVPEAAAAPQPLDVDALRRHLAGRLPEYMIPSFIVSLRGLPLTANGKCDRSALPRPDRAAQPRSASLRRPAKVAVPSTPKGGERP